MHNPNIFMFFGISIIFLLSFFFLYKILKSHYEHIIEGLQESVNNVQKDIEVENKESSNKNSQLRTQTTLEQAKKIEKLEREIDSREHRLSQMRAITQEAQDFQESFLAQIESRMSTPLKVVLELAEKKENFSEIGNLTRTIIKLLDKTKKASALKSSKFSLNETPVNVKKLFYSVIEKYENRMIKKDIDVIVNLDEEIPELLMLDQESVEDIFTIILDNAVKFTKKGTIEIALKREHQDKVRNVVSLEFSVKDSGVGISEEEQKKLFTLRNSLGINLFIGKKLAQTMHGDILCESTKNEGSQFVFSLKDVQIVLPSSDDSSTVALDFSLVKPNGRAVILVVDESLDLREDITYLFSKTTINVLSYDNPRDAIEAIKSNSVDVILMDISMLTSDNNAVAKILKTISGAPIVTLRDANVKDKIIVDEATSHIVDHLSKPLVEKELFSVLSNILNSETY